MCLYPVSIASLTDSYVVPLGVYQKWENTEFD